MTSHCLFLLAAITADAGGEGLPIVVTTWAVAGFETATDKAFEVGGERTDRDSCCVHIRRSP